MTKPWWETEDYDRLSMFREMEKRQGWFAIWSRLIRRSLYTDNHIETIEGVNYGEDLQVLPALVMAAKKIARTEALVWHYNTGNKDSYMRYANSREELAGKVQHMRSVIRFREIVERYDPDNLPQVDKIAVSNDALMLFQAAALKERRLFNTILKRCKTFKFYSPDYILGSLALLKKQYWFIAYVYVPLSNLKSKIAGK